MPLTDAKKQMIKDQVISKVHWGAGKEEVLTWLKMEKGIVGHEAMEIWNLANRKRKFGIRGRAFFSLIFSAVGVVGCAGFFLLQYFGRIIVIGWAPIAVVIMGVTSLGWLGKSLYRLLTGDAVGPVE